MALFVSSTATLPAAASETPPASAVRGWRRGVRGRPVWRGFGRVHPDDYRLAGTFLFQFSEHLHLDLDARRARQPDVSGQQSRAQDFG